MLSIDDIIAEPPAEGVILAPLSLFPTPGPFELEIGCGKGGFLLSRARANPHLRMLGIEWAAKFFRFAADRMARWQLTNVRVMRTDARELVMRHLPPACVAILHIYHPDPWPKKRHHKRRLIQPDFVEAALRALQPAGLWLVQSDHDDYWEQIEGLLGKHPLLERVEWEETGCAPGEDWEGTNFEIKYARAGSSIHRAAYRRPCSKSVTI